MTCGRSWSRDITARRAMKRDLYAEVSTRIVAELEAGAAPWVKPWSATAGIKHAMQRRDQSDLLRMQRLVVVDGTDGRLSHASLSDIQTGFGARRQRAEGRARAGGVFRGASPGSR